LRGEGLFDQHCLVCHCENAISGGVIPNLRASVFLGSEFFYDIVLDGTVPDRPVATSVAARLGGVTYLRR
jgi:mono/diheme cytochrome c family protein